MPRSQDHDQRVIGSTTARQSTIVTETGIKPEPVTKRDSEVKHEFVLEDELDLEHWTDRSVLGKRQRSNSSTPFVIKDEEEEDEDEDYKVDQTAETDDEDEDYKINQAVETDEEELTDRRSTSHQSRRPRVPIREPPPDIASQNPKSTSKNHLSRSVAARKRYKLELKALPDPKHLTEYARAADYEACKNLAIFLGEEFEQGDQTRLKTGRKLREANKEVKELKKEVLTLKKQVRETLVVKLDLKRKLRAGHGNDTDELRRSLNEAQTKLEHFDNQHKQDLADLQSEVKEHKSKRHQARLATAQEKERAEKLGAQLKASTNELTVQKRLLEKEREGRRYDQNTIDELHAASSFRKDEIQSLRAELEAKATSQADKAILEKKCQDLETELEAVKKKYDAQKQWMDKMSGVWHEMHSQK